MTGDFQSQHVGNELVVRMPTIFVVGHQKMFKQLKVEGELQDEPRAALDFQQCGYIDSSGIRTLDELRKTREQHGQELRLLNLNPDLTIALERANLDRFFVLDKQEVDWD